MKTHEMNLQPSYFDFIKDGTKRIELRLFDEKRQQIQLGDIIEFTKSEDDKFKAEVIGLLRYNSFNDWRYGPRNAAPRFKIEVS